jgi:hypothetical protein
MKKYLIPLLLIISSCNYHVKELENEFNPTGSTILELLQWALTFGLVYIIFWLIGKMNQWTKKRNGED